MDARSEGSHTVTLTRLVITGITLCLVAGCLAKMQVGQHNVRTCYTAKGYQISLTDGNRFINPKSVSDDFSLGEAVCVFTTFMWPYVDRDGESHLVEYRWYNSTGRVVMEQPRRPFLYPEFCTVGCIMAAKLGSGEHHVEIFTDGNLVATKEFRVSQKSGVKQGKTDAKPFSKYVSAYTLNEVDQPPRVLRSMMPRYPFEARQNGVEGRIILRFVVDKDGRVQEPQVVLSVPEGVFDQSALNAVVGYNFRPAYKDGKPVDCIVKLPIILTLVQ